MKSRAKIEFGDFQTPAILARQVSELLRQKGIAPKHVIEPTCGVGAFLVASAAFFPHATLRGWDVNPVYVQQTVDELRRAGVALRATVEHQDFFTHDWEHQFGKLHGELLILGNLPWVTNSTVSAMNGNNLPTKENFLGLRGLAARTGKANFDISEWMLIQLVRALRGRAATIAMLCKTATARKLLRYAWQNDGRIHEASLYRIDAAEHFEASVGACLLLAQTGVAGPAEADVYESLTATKPASRIGLAGQDLVADLRTYRKLQHLEGLCSFQWRSGVKHDCAPVMELKPAANGAMENKLGELVMLEPDCLYPLLKCSDLANGRTTPERLVLVTQQNIGGDTAGLARSAPQTWNYLQTHRDKLDARKSSIYKGSAPFALFGIGDYAFAPWKVAVSGLHRTARFQVVGPFQHKPVFLDDTCYFLPFESRAQAQLIADILNSPPCQRFIRALLFADTKRPITVELLQRLNLNVIAQEAGCEQRWRAMQNTNFRFAPAVPQYELVMETAKSGVRSRKRSAKIVSTSYNNPHHRRRAAGR
ncbi:MAG: SAM-dependent DNA methyltransferase [Pedosphaera sp.]|nr:SAM-dependent DNA methyltransferase [Pedosphaera sp.]